VVDDLCTQTSCPITPGVHNETSRSVFPDVKGLVNSKIQWEDLNGDVIWCVQMKWDVVKTGDYYDEASPDSSGSSTNTDSSSSSSSSINGASVSRGVALRGSVRA
jgi:hypothetical protein